MAGRRKTASRNTRARRTRGGPLRSVQRMVQHIATGTSVRARLPSDPPALTLGLQFERVLEYGFYYSTSGISAVTPPTPQEPGTVIWTSTTKLTAEQTFTNSLLNAGINGAFGVAGGIWAVKAVSFWGPDEPGINNRVEISAISSSILGLTVSDEGTRTRRARVRLTVPQLEWVKSGATGASEVFRVQVGVANNFAQPATTAKLGTLRVSISYKSTP